MMKVFIADDEASILEGLKYIINWKVLGFTICGEASNGEDTLNCILALKPDLSYWIYVCPNCKEPK